MPTTKTVSNLVINQVESQEIYDYMVANDLISADELYMVQGEAEDYVTTDELNDAISQASKVQFITWEDDD